MPGAKAMVEITGKKLPGSKELAVKREGLWTMINLAEDTFHLPVLTNTLTVKSSPGATVVLLGTKDKIAS